MQLPTEDAIKLLHQKYAPSDDVLNIVYIHCQIVWEIAEQLIKKNNIKVDVELVKVGCLLHDIGVYAVDKDNYVMHGLHGEEILSAAGYSQTICRFASHHTGVGIELDGKMYKAETQEEKLVMYADKFHSKTLPSHFNSYEWYKKYVARFGEDNVAKFEQLATEFGIPDLEILSQKYGHQIRD